MVFFRNASCTSNTKDLKVEIRDGSIRILRYRARLIILINKNNNKAPIHHLITQDTGSDGVEGWRLARAFF